MTRTALPGRRLDPARRPDRLVVLAGASKCGSTSLFEYLTDHPGIGRPLLKESRVLFPAGAVDEPADAFAARLREVAVASADQLALVSNSEYLYSTAVLERAAPLLAGGARVVVIVRDPVERIWSLLQHQRRFSGDGLGFDAWLAGQGEEVVAEALDPDRDGLVQGRFLEFVARWEARARPGHLRVVTLERLASDPQAVMQGIARWLDLDPAFYAGHPFQRHNAARSSRWPSLHQAYRALLRGLRESTIGAPELRALLRSAKRRLDPIYHRLNFTPPPAQGMSDAQRARLGIYYRAERAWLAAAAPDGSLPLPARADS